jgi:hypothetical protein
MSDISIRCLLKGEMEARAGEKVRRGDREEQRSKTNMRKRDDQYYKYKPSKRDFIKADP